MSLDAARQPCPAALRVSVAPTASVRLGARVGGGGLRTALGFAGAPFWRIFCAILAQIGYCPK
jgi:hypothetical protein